MNRPLIVARLLAVALLGTASVAQARQQADQPAEPPAAPLTAPTGPAVSRAGETYPEALRRLTADAFARRALSQLRGSASPSVLDYRLAGAALRAAASLEPEALGLARLEAEAWTNAGETELALDATRRILRLDPRNGVAQLRLISARIAELQNADDRLAAYRRLIGAESSVDDAVRSRLALDAALLARETGDERSFLEMLVLATSLDVTNKEAAALYASYYLDRTSDPRERVDILANVLLADPFDVPALENLALELMRHRAYGAAQRLWERARDVLAQRGGQFNQQQITGYVVALWGSEGPDAALEFINGAEISLERQAHLQRRALVAQGMDPSQAPEAQLPPLHLTLRLVIQAGRRAPETGETLDDLLSSIKSLIGGLQDPETREQRGVSDEQANEIVASLELQSVYARLLAGAYLDEVGAQLAAVDESGFVDETARQRFRGWLLVKRGEIEAGRALLEPLADEDRLARWALAEAAEAEGDERKAVAHYARLAYDHPTSALGLAALLRIENIRGEPLRRLKEAETLDAYALGIAPWLEAFTRSPHSFMQLDVVHVDPTPDAYDQIRLRVSIRNASGWPLAVGSGKPISPRVLLSPRLTVGGEDVTKDPRTARYFQPEVAILDNRLRLMPGETVSTDVVIDRTPLGGFLNRLVTAPLTLRWQAVQGFVFAEGKYHAGPLCLTTQSDLLSRGRLDMPAAQALADRLTRGEGFRLLEDVLLAQTAILRASVEQTPEAQQAVSVLASGVLDRTASAEGVELAYLILKAGEIGLTAPHLSLALSQLAVEDGSDIAAVAAAVTAGLRPDDPLVVQLEDSQDPDARVVGRVLRGLLERGIELRKAREADEALPVPGDAP